MKKYILIAIAIFLVLSAALSVWFYSNIKPISPGEFKKVNFMINRGDGLSSIGSRLDNLNLIKNKYCFVIMARILGLDKKIQAGNFVISPGLSVKEIIETLSTAGSQDYWLQIIGGMRNEEISLKFPEKVPFNPEEFLDISSDEQGYLFPDSYLIPEFYSPEQIIKIIKKNFDLKMAEAKLNPTDTEITDSQAVTLASLLEREGRTLESKQHIAGILQNRLKINMALQIDASVQYVRDTVTSPKKYWEPLQKSDLKIISSFNTYLNPGLPPSPICNPGFDSIYAAFHPIPSDYFYYITGNDNKMHYAKTLEEHNNNIYKYLN